MAATDNTMLGQMDDYILDGKFHEATDMFCRLAVDGQPIQNLITHAMRTASPYLHVPAHEKLLPNGEFRNVNYDHTILGVRAGMRLMPYLSPREKNLTVVQAMYYIPQGLDVWAQLECGFPGHYAREQERCEEEQIGRELHCYFEDQEPLLSGSVEDRFQHMFHALTQGDKATSYRLFLGLAQQPELRQRLQDTLLFASIIDQQEYNSFRKVRHIGHKAIRTRSMLDIADWLGWENAHPYFYIGVPDICTAPIFHSLYDHASWTLGITFKGGQYGLVETNSTPLTEEEQDHFIAQILSGDTTAVTNEITGLLQKGKSVQGIADMVFIAMTTFCVNHLRAPIAYTVPMHCLDYCNAVNHWLRNFANMHQSKGVYLSAWFITDTIHEVNSYGDIPGVTPPDPASRRAWADSLALPQVLEEIEKAIEVQDPSTATALAQSYVERTGERDQLIHQMVHCAAKFQGDAHIFRNSRSLIEEYMYNTASEKRKNILFAYWAHYLTFYKKRTMARDCYDMYHRYFTN